MLYRLLIRAAAWCDHHNEAESTRRYRSNADRSAELGGAFAFLGEQHLARTYAPIPPQHPGSSPMPLNAPPVTPPLGR
ncbi:hypothetical protein ACFQ69_02505 [Streptomyces sp. NPDC056470]|uniref:hypothetical protein n=1 Tax=Streptomyces sp. NPDC056470 TaxID=3345831 RepID=UPI0036B2821F